MTLMMRPSRRLSLSRLGFHRAEHAVGDRQRCLRLRRRLAGQLWAMDEQAGSSPVGALVAAEPSARNQLENRMVRPDLAARSR